MVVEGLSIFGADRGGGVLNPEGGDGTSPVSLVPSFSEKKRQKDTMVLVLQGLMA
jgi:hypothetical protein